MKKIAAGLLALLSLIACAIQPAGADEDGAGYGKDLLDFSNQFGIYAAAMIPEIAVYPEELPAVFLAAGEEQNARQEPDDEAPSEGDEPFWRTYALAMTAADVLLLILLIAVILIARKRRLALRRNNSARPSRLV